MSIVAKKWKEMVASEHLIQMFKFSLSGVFLTCLYSAIYLLLSYNGNSTMAAHFSAYIFSILVGFIINRFWSFRNFGHNGRHIVTGIRYALVAIAALALNTLFVWSMTIPPLSLPAWAPLLPILFVTPLVTFALSRKWTFA